MISWLTTLIVAFIWSVIIHVLKIEKECETLLGLLYLVIAISITALASIGIYNALSVLLS